MGMNRQQAINYLYSSGFSEEQVKTIAKAFEPATKNDLAVDCISRNEVLNRLASIAKIKAKSDAQKSLMGRCIFMVECMPSVTPQEPKTGHWILKRTFPTKLYDEYLNEYKCSECYREIRCSESQLVNYPYCHCGAKMIEPQESEGTE